MLSRKLGKLAVTSATSVNMRAITTSTSRLAKDNYKLLIVGGGSGGVTISSKFSRVLGSNNVAIIEPNDSHCTYLLLLLLLKSYEGKNI